MYDPFRVLGNKTLSLFYLRGDAPVSFSPQHPGLPSSVATSGQNVATSDTNRASDRASEPSVATSTPPSTLSPFSPSSSGTPRRHRSGRKFSADIAEMPHKKTSSTVLPEPPESNSDASIPVPTSSGLENAPEISHERADEVTRPLFQPAPLSCAAYREMQKVLHARFTNPATLSMLWERFAGRWWHRPPVERLYLWDLMKQLACTFPVSWDEALLNHLHSILTDPWEDDLRLLNQLALDTLHVFPSDDHQRQRLWAAWSIRFTQLPCRGRTVAIRVLRELDRRCFPGALAAEMVDFYKVMVLPFPALWWREVTSYDPRYEDNLVTLLGNYLFETSWDIRHAPDLEKLWRSCLQFARPEEQRTAGEVLRLIAERQRTAEGTMLPPLPPRPGETLRGPIPQDVILLSVYRQRF